MIIVIDGPAGSGKSSTAKAVAQRMHIEYLDSGALYRAVTWCFLELNGDEELFFKKLKQMALTFSYRDEVFYVSIDGQDITQELRKMPVSKHVSKVAAMPQVRDFINGLMREQVKKGHYIAEGRDLGSAVFKDAELKFFMSADARERARRRYKEQQKAGESATFAEIQANIEARDRQDAARTNDPLKKAPDAIELNTTNMRFDEQVQQICSVISDQTDLSIKQ